MYANQMPTAPWRGTQSTPRQLRLRRFREGLRLVQEPVQEIESLRGENLDLRNVSVAEANRAIRNAEFGGSALELQAEIAVRDARDMGFRLLRGEGEETLVGFTTAPAEVYIDRTESGDSSFHESFAGRHSARLEPVRGIVELRILVDRSVVEVFAGGGRATITDRVFPRPESTGLSLYSAGGEAHITRLRAWKLQSVWK